MIAPIDPTSSETSGDIELVARLVRTGGSRLDPPREAYDRVFAAASAALETRLAQRRRVRWTRSLALAASVVLAAGAALWVGLREPVNLQVATAEHQSGLVTLLAAGQPDWQTLAPGTLVTQGSWLRTGAASGVALRMTNGLSLRIDAGSAVSFETPRRVRVQRGAVYVDSQAGDARLAAVRPSIEIVTPLATARDVGTQFEVRLIDSDTLLRVREGSVWLTHEGGEVKGRAGEQLRVEPGGGLARSAIASADPAWDWVVSMAAAPEIDDQPLSSVLAWVSRETGRSIRYDSPATERRAAAAILHGSIRGLEPLPALETVLATSALGYRIVDDGTILITSL
jgi:ferric-dicitrate binding protein FerR (iron transport regulator)